MASIHKRREVLSNPKISVLIDVNEPAQAVLLVVTAQVVSGTEAMRLRSEEIYARYVVEQEVKKDPCAIWARDPDNRLIILKPVKVTSWSGKQPLPVINSDRLV